MQRVRNLIAVGAIAACLATAASSNWATTTASPRFDSAGESSESIGLDAFSGVYDANPTVPREAAFTSFRRPSVASTPCSLTPRPAGWLAKENQLRGSLDWQWSNKKGNLQGYIGDVSATCGTTVPLYISTSAVQVQALAFRMGYYNGVGARLVWASPVVLGRGHQAPLAKQPGSVIDAQWPASIRMPITGDFVPGAYLIKLVDNSGASWGMPFVVRDSLASAPIYMPLSVNTYQAYNFYGGKSAYVGFGNDYAERSRVVSFNRPYSRGDGSGQMLDLDYPLIRFMEQMGLDVAYSTDVDMSRTPKEVLGRKAIVFGAHAEYWSSAMFDAVEKARDAGTNIVNFGANTAYWQVRYSPDYRWMEIYKDVKEDPIQGPTTSVRFRETGRPEGAVLGQQFDGGMRTNTDFTVVDATAWPFHGTGLKNGDVLERAVGIEWDRAYPQATYSPKDLQVLANGTLWSTGRKQPSLATMTYYSVPSGAGVLSIGSIAWLCNLDQRCAFNPADVKTSVQVRAITANILRNVAQGPVGKKFPSRAKAPTMTPLDLQPPQVLPGGSVTAKPGGIITVTAPTVATATKYLVQLRPIGDGKALSSPTLSSPTYAFRAVPAGAYTVQVVAGNAAGYLAPVESLPGKTIVVPKDARFAPRVLSR